MNTKSHLRVRALTEGAVLVAMAQVLSLLKLYEFPQGGSITLDMVPIFLYCFRWGFGPGMLASAAYAVLQLVTGAYAWTWQSIFGDYLIPFTLLGVCGAFRRLPGGLYLGTAAGCLARFLSHYLTGATVWAEYMPESFFGLTMTSPWFYSLLYNGSYMLLDCLLCLLLFALLGKTSLKTYLRSEDLR